MENYSLQMVFMSGNVENCKSIQRLTFNQSNENKTTLVQVSQYLPCLSYAVIYLWFSYLIPNRIGSGDAGIYKLLSIHVDTLLPPTALEVNVPHSSHVAALVSVGLLFMGTCDRHLVKMMLLEMSRPPGPEMNKAADRESHSLAAGFALGMIMLAVKHFDITMLK